MSTVSSPADSGISTVGDLVRLLRKELTPRYGRGEAEAMIRMIFDCLKGWSQVDIIVNEPKPVSDFIVSECRRILDRLAANEPIQYVLGKAYFYGLELGVRPGVLIPRPETEQLVDMIADAHKESDLRVLDVGTGSGCIVIALSRNLSFPDITALDVSPDALAVARENAEKLKCRIRFVEADIFTYSPGRDSFDIIVSNPPYIDNSERAEMEPNVVDHEPHLALFVSDEDPLVYYRRIAEVATEALRAGGGLYFEINPHHAEELAGMLSGMGFTDVETVLDIHSRKRFITAVKPAER